ncbi:YfhO family protein, partial [Candidatus Gottesmanbacteria bacterium]|nr:YfhO family protein [Candidatus Gottesmanbacteria bacterium]
MGRRSRYVFGVLITLWLTFFWRQIVGGEVWYCCDNLLVNIPAKVFFSQELIQGRFPLWNPYIFSGTPFFADINLAVLHPLNLLYLALLPFRALTLSILVLFLVGSIGMYVLSKAIRLSSFASVTGAIVFGFSGTLIVYANNISILQVVVLVPWVIAMWIGYWAVPSGKRLAAFVLVASLQVLSGHPQFTYYTWLILIAYTAFQPSLPWSVRLRHLIKAVLLVLLVSSVQAVPFVEFAFSSTRVGRDFAYATIDSIHPLSLIRLILPGIVGDLSRGTAWIQGGSIHGYVGILPLLLFPVAWRTPHGRFFAVIAVISLIMAMGKYTPVFWLAYHVIPGIAWFRQPGQFLFLWSFGLAVVTSIALDTLIKRPTRAQYILAFALFVLIGAGVIRLQGFGLWELLHDLPHVPDRLQQKLFALPPSQRQIITDGILYNLSLVGTLLVLAALAIHRLYLSGFTAKVFIVGLLFADLYVYGQTNVTTIHETIVRGWQEEQRTRIAFWKLSETSKYRYYTDPAVYPYPEKKPFGQFNDPGESAWQFAILRPNTGMLYGLSAVDGYASMVSSSYQRWFGQPSRDPTGVTISSIVDPRLGGSGVRYILTKPNNPLFDDTKRYRVLAVDGEIAIYEDNKAVSTEGVPEVAFR